ncbi:MAG TPA: hypothetical protein VIY26_18170, partial [Acidimicrobiales bacterium]
IGRLLRTVRVPLRVTTSKASRNIIGKRVRALRHSHRFGEDGNMEHITLALVDVGGRNEASTVALP